MNHYENKRNICYPSGGNPTFDPPAILIGWSRFIIYYIHGLITFATHGLQTDITQDANLMRLIQFISAICTFCYHLSPWLGHVVTIPPLSISQENHRRQDLDSHLSLHVLIFSGYQFARIAQQADGVTAFMAPIEEWMRAQKPSPNN